MFRFGLKHTHLAIQHPVKIAFPLFQLGVSASWRESSLLLAFAFLQQIANLSLFKILPAEKLRQHIAIQPEFLQVVLRTRPFHPMIFAKILLFLLVM